jgi:predicted phage tail protein
VDPPPAGGAGSGRFGKTRLKPGKYQATVVATDAAGQQSAPVTVRFRIAGR